MMSSLFTGEEIKENYYYFSPKKFLDTLVETTFFCQNYVKKLNNNASSLSLRDIVRVKNIFKFCLSCLAYEKKYTSKTKISFEKFNASFKPDFKKIDQKTFLCALLVSINLNYINRIVKSETKYNLLKEISKIIKKNLSYNDEENILVNFLKKENHKIINRICKLGKIPKDIAINTPLKENLFAIFVAIYSKTPLFICGKPGSSKSISLQIIKKTFDGQVIGGNNDFLDGMKPLRIEYYQGSDQSTDKGIEKVFIKALYHQNQGKKQSVVFIDEIGLAELSPNNPLKVLHKYLDTTSHENNKSNTF